MLATQTTTAPTRAPHQTAHVPSEGTASAVRILRLVGGRPLAESLEPVPFVAGARRPFRFVPAGVR